MVRMIIAILMDVVLLISKDSVKELYETFFFIKVQFSLPEIIFSWDKN